MSSTGKSSFLSDGVRPTHYVLIYKKSLLTYEKQEKIEYYVWSLSKKGVVIEADRFTANADIVFVKLHVPNHIAFQYADIFDLDLMCRNTVTKLGYGSFFNFMATPLTKPNPIDDVYKRSSVSLSESVPENATRAEIILILVEIMKKTRYGQRPSEYGLYKLLKDKVFIDSFPLHDGPFEWSESGTLNARQLLARYWGSFKCWYKLQPLHQIEQYYGPEYAFYFACYGFYVKMLVPAAVMSILCVTFGLTTFKLEGFNTASAEICKSDMYMCPTYHFDLCKFEQLNDYCFFSYLTYLFDNPATVAMSCVISFWSTIFMEFWQRKQSGLMLQWNLMSLEVDTTVRPEFHEKASYMLYSEITGRLEPMIAFRKIVYAYAITASSMILLVMVMISAFVGVMVYKVSMSHILLQLDIPGVEDYYHLIASFTGAMISACIIQILTMVFRKLALWLTDIEYHRTQSQFDESFIYKNYALSFVNNYSSVFYVAFFKGKFYTYPGDIQQWKYFGGMRTDVCSPTGCIADLSINLMVIMTAKLMGRIVVTRFIPFVYTRVNALIQHVNNYNELPSYEQQYLQPPTKEYFLVDEYMNIVIQYGFVVFFVAGFPLAPALALVSNVFDLRLEAYRITRCFRRPIPKRVAGVGAWFAILQAVTYAGVVTNALVIATTSEFVPRLIYRFEHGLGLSGYVNSTLSAFVVSDYELYRSRGEGPPEICYYYGRRNPPGHEYEYQLTKDFWYIACIRFIVVVVFEHILMFANSIVAYAIPDIPQHIKEALIISQKEDREVRVKMNMENRSSQAKSRKINVVL